MMKRWLIWRLLCSLALTLSQAVPAQENKPAPSADRHPLWKVESGTNVVYLLGSIHLLKPEDYPLPLPIERAFTKAQVVAFETDIDKLQGVDAAAKLMTGSMLPAGETLQDQLTPATYTALTNHLDAAGVPLVMVDHLKPFMAAAMLEIMELQKLGFDDKSGVDVHFFNLARDDGKTIIPLETVDFQISMITDFTKDEGEMVMKSQLEEIDDTAKDFDKMITAWKTGDAPALAQLLNDALHESPTIFKRLVSDRSASWIPRIEEMLRDGRTGMVIVGAGHLVGDEGVVALLRKKGLKVTQM